MKSKTICALPWVQVSTSIEGIYRLCCLQTGTDVFNHIKVLDVPIKEMWHSKEYNRVRDRMLKGEYLDCCARCYREEDAGLESARMRHNKNWGSYISEPKILLLDLRLGNICNLKCRMCNPAISTAWIEDEKKLSVRNYSKTSLEKMENYDWYNQESFWNDLTTVLDSCEMIYLSGGEPALLMDQQIKLFDKCIEMGVAKNIEIEYNTNLTIDVSKTSKYWKHFKHTKINCSIDGIGEVNDYIRYPSKWDRVEKNFLLLHEMTKGNNAHINPVITVQILNILHLNSIFEYLKELKLKATLNILDEPNFYNVKVLPKNLKDKAIKRLSTWNVPELIEYMTNEDWSHLYPKFLRETEILDKDRNQKENGWKTLQKYHLKK